MEQVKVRINFDIDEEWHIELKQHCARQKITLARWIRKAMKREYTMETKKEVPK